MKNNDLSVLPLQPGDEVYLLHDDGTPEKKRSTSVGVHDDGHLVVVIEGERGELFHTLGEDVFLTEEDAVGSQSLGDGYCVLTEEEMASLPYRPDTYYLAAYDGFYGWKIYQEICDYIFYDQNGDIRANPEEEDEIPLPGGDTYMMFTSLRKARAFVRKKEKDGKSPL